MAGARLLAARSFSRVAGVKNFVVSMVIKTSSTEPTSRNMLAYQRKLNGVLGVVCARAASPPGAL